MFAKRVCVAHVICSRNLNSEEPQDRDRLVQRTQRERQPVVKHVGRIAFEFRTPEHSRTVGLHSPITTSAIPDQAALPLPTRKSPEPALTTTSRDAALVVLGACRHNLFGGSVSKDSDSALPERATMRNDTSSGTP